MRRFLFLREKTFPLPEDFESTEAFPVCGGVTDVCWDMCWDMGVWGDMCGNVCELMGVWF